MNPVEITYRPALGREAAERDLRRLLVTGTIRDSDLEGRIARLEERFGVYSARYPMGTWAPGLAVTHEMRRLTEIYLPMAEIRGAFRRFFSVSLKFRPFLATTPICASSTWPEFLTELNPQISRANPAPLLERLLADEGYRKGFLFAHFLPRRHGGAFGRYPAQAAFLRRWLAGNRARVGEGISCLDAACGTGEGTYELALLLLESGFPADRFRVRGSTLEPLELFSAAHLRFPHDLRREESCRRRVEEVFARGGAERMLFTREDLTSAEESGESHDVILCNGLLGGPLMHGKGEAERVLRLLAGRLLPGGILLAADRFHGGWKKAVPASLLREMLTMCGLRVIEVEEGVAGTKTVKGDR